MNQKKTTIELLAPAKNLECGTAAINSGADAVYVGAPKFSARSAAGNSLADIEKLISYAHKYWAKVYVALNTILFDNELESAGKIIRSVYDSGADGLIIQDMGLLEIGLPPIPLIASTQTHNYEIEKIQFLERVGFQRVILARELSLRQIEEIRSKTEIELEFFVHGALCVCYSGQCYLSEATQGRSANRGECAQPCRLPYTLTDADGSVIADNKYLLSLKDLNLSREIPALLKAGITAFKIEGRLKDVEYVKNITAFYRNRLDVALTTGMQRASSGTTTTEFVPDPVKTFNRGFTNYFVHKRSKDNLSRSPKSIGVLIGKVLHVEKDCFQMESAELLSNGDGICFFDEFDRLHGTNINTVERGRIYPASIEGITVGMEIYRNHDHQFIKTLNHANTKRKITASIEFSETEDGYSLKATDEDGIEAEYIQRCKKIKAEKPDQAEAAVKKQISKSGESIFEISEIRVYWKEPAFLPIAVLNEMRREFIKRLESKRINMYPRRMHAIVLNEIPFPQKNLDYRANVVNKKAKEFYKRHGVESVEPGFEIREQKDGTLMTMKHCLRFQFGLCEGRGKAPEPLFLRDIKNRYRLEFDCARCEMRVVLESTKNGKKTISPSDF
jgi:putative protease